MLNSGYISWRQWRHLARHADAAAAAAATFVLFTALPPVHPIRHAEYYIWHMQFCAYLWANLVKMTSLAVVVPTRHLICAAAL